MAGASVLNPKDTFAGGEVMAEQRVTFYYSTPYQSVVWMHTDPAGSDASSQIGGVTSLEHEFDPMGVDVGTVDPATIPVPYVPDPPVPTYTGGGPYGPHCTLDNVEYDCNDLFNLLSHGSAAIAPPQTYVPVYAHDLDTGERGYIGFAKWNGQNNSYDFDARWRDHDLGWQSQHFSWGGGQSNPLSLGNPVGQPTEYVNVVQGGDGGGGTNRENKVAPRSGSCTLSAPDFANIKSYARNLLERTFGKGAAAFYNGMGTYNQAVFLNTITALASQGVPLNNARFVGFYNTEESRAFYGIELSGITGKELDNAGLGKSWKPGIGRRSPDEIKEASIEASTHGSNFAFDIDLYNAKSNFKNHAGEVNFNSRNHTSTHPADVTRLLYRRGVFSGVTCGSGGSGIIK